MASGCMQYESRFWTIKNVVRTENHRFRAHGILGDLTVKYEQLRFFWLPLRQPLPPLFLRGDQMPQE